ncbi:MAG TPA: glycosyltransferase family 87 protein [Thermoanaerobaculia bacterium]
MSENVADETASSVRESARLIYLAMVLAVSAAALRLIPLQWLHPLNWDELEFFRATRWIAEGKVPFRDFWEHHTPLMWYLFAPFAALIETEGVTAVIALRWAQIPVWVFTFWCLNLWMKGAGVGAFARWAAMALALSSSMLMIPAVEYRIESLGCALFMAGLLLAQRRRMFLAGGVLCLAVWANLRLAPVVVVAALLLPMLMPDERRWRANRVALRVMAGGAVVTLLCLAYFLWTGSIRELYEQLWADNRAERYAAPVAWGFLHRLLIPFGVRLLAGDRAFDLAGIDLGGAFVLLIGVVGLLGVLRRRLNPDWIFVIAVLQVSNLLFVAWMKFIYNYHLVLLVVMMVPLIGWLIDRTIHSASESRQRLVVSGIFMILGLAWCGNVFASVFRGKEMDRAYQDLIMREVHARTGEGEVVWSGIPLALHREPAYRFWFLPELTRQLVRQQHAEPYHLDAIHLNPPVAVVFDHNALVWIGTVQRELAPFFIRHYIPVWRNLWMPGMNGLLWPGRDREWLVPRDGDYAVFTSPEITQHLWFRDPLLVARRHDLAAMQFTLSLPAPSAPLGIEWFVDGEPIASNPRISLRRGQRLRAEHRGTEPFGIILYAGADRVLFRQPSAGVTLDGETLRVTHFPRIGARIEP